MTTTIGLFEAKTKLGQLVTRVEQGEEIVITRHDKPVARLVPEARRNRSELQEAFERFKVVRKACLLNPAGTPRVTLKELAREGLK